MNHHRDSGYILVGVLLAITILSVVGVSLVSLSANSVKISSSERDNQAVYYIAEAGLIFLASEFEQAVSEIYEKDSVIDMTVKRAEEAIKNLKKYDGEFLERIDNKKQEEGK